MKRPHLNPLSRPGWRIAAVVLVVVADVAIWSMTHNLTPHSVNRAIEILEREDLDYDQQDQARSYLIARMGDESVVELVSEKCVSTPYGVNGAFVEILESVNNPATTHALIALLYNDNCSESAAYALAVRGNPVCRDALIKAISRARSEYRDVGDLELALSRLPD